jgi:uncharacterized BrkB/YihY/UPF0761 family membrane protein
LIGLAGTAYRTGRNVADGYGRHAGSQRLYGPLAGVFAFLLLVYLVGTILLLGAELIVAREDAAGRTGGA